MTIYLNIDDTVCDMPEGEVDYSLATPINKNINKINKMFNEGHQIIYWTSRVFTKKDPLRVITGAELKKETHKARVCRETIRQQLTNWNVKFHDIRFDLHNFDIIVSNKAKKMFDF
ncbi:MAG TPA: hypothetical protein DEG69_12560 [Flavobacteriaceae bacterium]|nr:hypothetical protein [Flavobacteriaceae bacterium]